MANSYRNLLTHNFSGKIGDQVVLRSRGSKTIMAAIPKKRKSVTLTDLTQAAIRQAFQRSVLYAKSAMSDPAMKEAYAAVRRENQSAFNVAFMDAFKGPVLSDLRFDKYKGEVGQQIVVGAIDNFRVKAVTFAILSADGDTLEEGDAVLAPNGFHWTFTAQVANPAVAGTTIRITASDIPDNQTVLEKVL